MNVWIVRMGMEYWREMPLNSGWWVPTMAQATRMSARRAAIYVRDWAPYGAECVRSRPVKSRMSPQEIATVTSQAKTALDRATRGPWHTHYTRGGAYGVASKRGSAADEPDVVRCCRSTEDQEMSDAIFIAGSREWVAQLIEALRLTEARAVRAEKKLAPPLRMAKRRGARS